MIRKGHSRKESFDSPHRNARQTRAIGSEIGISALNIEFQKKLKELHAANQRQLDELRVEQQQWKAPMTADGQRLKEAMVAENRRLQEAATTGSRRLPDPHLEPLPGPSFSKRDFSDFQFYSCVGMGHTTKVCRKRADLNSRGCFHCKQPGHFKRVPSQVVETHESGRQAHIL